MSSCDAVPRLPSSRHTELLSTSESCTPMTKFPFIFPKDFDGSRIVIAECDPAKSPYALDDILCAIQPFPEAKEVRTVGPMSLNYVQVIEFVSAEAAAAFARRATISVKGTPAMLTRVASPETAILLNWIWPTISDDLVEQKFSSFGKVRRIIRLKSHRPGFEQVETTSRLLLLERHAACSLAEIPYIVHISGFRIAVNISSRPPLCWKCSNIGHVRSACKAAPCDRCHRFTHTTSNCPVSSANDSAPAGSPVSVVADSPPSLASDFPVLPSVSRSSNPPAPPSLPASPPSPPPLASPWRSRSPVRSPRLRNDVDLPVMNDVSTTRTSALRSRSVSRISEHSGTRRPGRALERSLSVTTQCFSTTEVLCSDASHCVVGEDCIAGSEGGTAGAASSDLNSVTQNPVGFVQASDLSEGDICKSVSVQASVTAKTCALISLDPAGNDNCEATVSTLSNASAGSIDSAEYILPHSLQYESNIQTQNSFQPLSEQLAD